MTYNHFAFYRYRNNRRRGRRKKLVYSAIHTIQKKTHRLSMVIVDVSLYSSFHSVFRKRFGGKNRKQEKRSLSSVLLSFLHRSILIRRVYQWLQKKKTNFSSFKNNDEKQKKTSVNIKSMFFFLTCLEN